MSELEELPPGIQAGAIVADKYRIERILGTGGMGVVVAAQHLQLEERFAIKFMLPKAAQNAEAVSRFAREARAAARIRSEHIARVVDVSSMPSGVPYMVMEYLDGIDLASWLESRGPLPQEKAIDFLLQACEAIADAHGLGIIHRDLKPANLFCVRQLDGRELIKVLDFGISKATFDGSRSSLRMTNTTEVFGSPLYMSPEQMLSTRNVDMRTDIWSLGVILYELLTAHSPFDAATLPEVYVKISTSPPPPLRNHCPDAPIELEAVISKCLEKDRALRYANVGELARALLPFAPRRSRASIEHISMVLQATGLTESAMAMPPSSNQLSYRGTTDTMAAWGQTKPNGVRRTWQLALVAVLVLPLTAGMFLAGYRVLMIGLTSGASGGGATPNAAAAPSTAAGTTRVESSVALSLSTPPLASSPPSVIVLPVSGTGPVSATSSIQSLNRTAAKSKGRSVRLDSDAAVPAAVVSPQSSSVTPATAPMTDVFHRQH